MHNEDAMDTCTGHFFGHINDTYHNYENANWNISSKPKDDSAVI